MQNNLVKKGDLTFKKNATYSVPLSRDWSEVTNFNMGITNLGKTNAYVAPKVKLLTLDGPDLNRLYVSEGLKPGEPLMIGFSAFDLKKPVQKEVIPPRSLAEQQEFIVRSLSLSGYQKVEADPPEPLALTGSPRGLRFTLTAKDNNGLNIKGLAQVIIKNDLCYYMVYLAPEVHYYKASLADALVSMDGVKLP